jgi:hypothetical protein
VSTGIPGSGFKRILNFTEEEIQPMNVWVPILLLLILAEVWWFGAHCTAYLSDIRDLSEKMIKMTEGASGSD